MAGGKLDLWQAGSLAKGVNVNQPDFQVDLQLTDSTYNVTSGILEGIGPRYGFSPIPGQMDQETVSSGQFPGLMRYEIGLTNGTSSEYKRYGIYAIYPAILDNAGLTTESTYYAYLVWNQVVGSAYFCYDVLISSTLGSSNTIVQSPYIYSGLPYTGLSLIEVLTNDAGFSNFYGDLGTELLVVAVGTLQNVYGDRFSYLENLSQINENTNYASSAFVSISGSDIPNNWIYGKVTTAPAVTTSAGLNLSQYNNTTPAIGLFLGYPSSMNYQTVINSARTIYQYCLSDGFVSPTNFLDYLITYSPGSGLYNATLLENATNTAVGGVTAAQASYSGSTAYSSIKSALMYDSSLTCNSSFKACLIAGNNPMIVLFQEWYRGYQGSLNQYVDPTNYSTSPTALNIPSSGTTVFTGANTGALLEGYNYEISYSIYNKRLNHETNVCTNTYALQNSPTVNNVGIVLFDNGSGLLERTTIAYTIASGGTAMVPPFPYFGGTVSPPILEQFAPLHLNYLEYRFYYRQIGSQYWLPALFIDAAKLWFYPHFGEGAAGTGALTMCTAPVGGTVGGVAGGLNDYSPLPSDTYDCTLMYKNRAFWISSKNMVFSNTNNIFAYAARNIASCPQGSFKGAIVQAYYGQAIQNSRLVIFSTEGTYVGQFTGNPLTEQVIISPTSGATVQPLDGSDFVINAWTSVSAFSYRSAVVAEGLLYYWGPQGIFMDDGVDPIQRVSVPLEPGIFNLYDSSQTDKIHCEYNDTTKEIWWFYPPLGGDDEFPTHGICYNKLKNTFLPGKFAGQIDAVQAMHIDNNVETAGTRFIAYSRLSPSSEFNVQRAYYFNQNNLAADIFPGGELMVKAISSPTTTTRLLTLAAGYSTGTIAAGDLICLQQCAAYTAGALTTPSDFIAKVTAVGTGTITIAIPTGATLDASATILSNADFFPVWHAAGTNGVITGPGINGFEWEIDTKFWIPGGMSYWAYWLWMHMVYKLYDLLPGPAPVMNFNYQSPTSVGNAPDTPITLSDNSLNNFQILRGLARGNMNAEGQGIKLTWSGIQLGSSWMLQFLETYAQGKDGNPLLIFQG